MKRGRTRRGEQGGALFFLESFRSRRGVCTLVEERRLCVCSPPVLGGPGIESPGQKERKGHRVSWASRTWQRCPQAQGGEGTQESFTQTLGVNLVLRLS